MTISSHKMRQAVKEAGGVTSRIAFRTITVPVRAGRMTDRVCIVLNARGEIEHIAADGDTELLIVCPDTPADRVYSYGAVDRGPEHVRRWVGGYAVGHLHDGRLGDGDGTGRRAPSRPTLKPIK